MKTPCLLIVLAAASLGPAAQAADVTLMTRGPTNVYRTQPVERPIVRLADQELGYSVLHREDVSARGYRVHLTCTMDESFVQTYCPTTQYVATCPRATISCQ
jgi:hypothetical protein